MSVTEQIDTETWWGRLVLAVLGSLAEAYLHQTSIITRNGLGERRNQGLPLGRIPLGYCNGLCSTCKDVNGAGYCPLYGGPDRPESRRGRVGVPHPVDRHVIPLIFQLYQQNFSFREISIYLNNTGFTMPDGTQIHFRPRGQLGGKAVAHPQFSPESIRTILENPFPAGFIARHPRPEFSTEDDIHHPENIPVPHAEGNSREILELIRGVHETLISMEEWQAVRDLCNQKSTTPSTSTNHVRIYPLSGIGRCWECFEETGQDFTLRGSTGGKAVSYYRCAYMHDHELRRKTKREPRVDGLNPLVTKHDPALRERHKTLRADKIEPQIDAIMSRLVIQPEWYETIMAYYLADAGLSDFEREGYNLRQSLKRFKDLHIAGHISAAEFEQQARYITTRLDALKPSARPEAAEITPWLDSFSSTWPQLTNGEKRILLHVVFAGLYFDRHGTLRKALAHEPFDELLGLPNDGILNQ